MKYLRVIFSSILPFLLIGCATQVPPSGGAKDTTPPKVLSYNPANNSLRIKSGTKISFAFDEFVELSKLNEQFIVSPPVNKLPETQIKGKKIIITLPDSLQENTTYSMFFGDAIVNFKESLSIKNFSYAFSTGDYLDSLKISGQVFNSYDNKPAENVYVILYRDTISLPGKFIKPYYLSKTRADGKWQISNMAAGKYQIFAIKDLNSNYLFDQAEEEIAFLDSLVQPYSAIIYPDSIPDSLRVKPTSVNLYLFKEIPKTQSVVSTGTLAYFQIITTFRSSTKDLKFEPIKTSIPDLIQFQKPNLRGDTVITWLKNFTMDTLYMKISDEGTIIDTSRYYLAKARRNADSSLYKNFSAQLLSEGTHDFFKPLLVRFPFPILNFKPEQIKIIKTSTKGIDTISTMPIKLDSTPFTILMINQKFEEKTKYQLYAPAKCFENIYDKYNDTLRLDFTSSEGRAYGSLKLKMENTKNHAMIIQLINAEDKLVSQNTISSDTIIRYKYLRPGAYKLKAIYDKDNSGSWSTGDYTLNVLPERVFYLPSAINIRANWDIDWKWILE